MKKRILLSLVSFFAMTAMWASLVDAYRIEVSAAAAGKTGATAELTLNMFNRNATIESWQCTVQLPEGVTYVDGSAAIVDARYPEGYNAELTATVNADGTVSFACAGAEGIALTGTAGAVATFSVKIDASVEPGDYKVVVVETKTYLTEVNHDIHQDQKAREYTWTIEKGEDPGIAGDLNGDGKVDIGDAVCVLGVMADGTNDPSADLNGDGKVDIADFVTVLGIMAEQ